MKTRYLLLIVLSLNVVKSTFGQRPWKEYLIPGTAILISGFLEGTDESILFHYQNGFKQKFPNASDQYWDPSISWKNKYKNNDMYQGEKFLGSTNLFVATTDAHHMLRLTHVIADVSAMTYCINNNHKEKNHKVQFVNWKTIAQDFIVLSVVRTIGFHLAYNGLFAVQTNPVNP